MPFFVLRRVADLDGAEIALHAFECRTSHNTLVVAHVPATAMGEQHSKDGNRL